MKKYLIMIACALSLASCTDYLEPEGEIVYREVTIPENITGIEIGSGMLLVLSDDAPAGKASIRTRTSSRTSGAKWTMTKSYSPSMPSTSRTSTSP